MACSSWNVMKLHVLEHCAMSVAVSNSFSSIQGGGPRVPSQVVMAMQQVPSQGVMAKKPKQRLRTYPGVSSLQIMTAIKNYLDEHKLNCIWSAFEVCFGAM